MSAATDIPNLLARVEESMVEIMFVVVLRFSYLRS